MKYSPALFSFGSLMVLVSLAGCETSPVEPKLERIKTIFLTPNHYVVAHDGYAIGTYTRAASVTDKKSYDFRTTLTMPSANGLNLTTEAVYQFHTSFPYLLSTATSTTHSGNIEVPYRVEPVYPAAQSNRSDRQIENQYGLSDFFALELALMLGGKHAVNELQTSVTPYLDASSSTTWVVQSRSDQSVKLSSSAGDIATYSIEQTVPILDSLVDNTGLSMQRIPIEEFQNLEIQPLHVVEDIRVPVDRPIANPNAVSTLVVQFEFADGDRGPWAAVLGPQSTMISSSVANRSPIGEFDWHGHATGISSNKVIQDIVVEVIKDNDEPDQVVDGLVQYVNQTISYEAWNKLQSVEETLARKVGDCTELAQLFTALATAADLTARTVVGLAYQEDSQTFGIHTWNEIRFKDDSVRVVDPTWNQTFADATHIEFPPGYQHEIVRTLKNLQLKVVEVTYDLPIGS